MCKTPPKHCICRNLKNPALCWESYTSLHPSANHHFAALRNKPKSAAHLRANIVRSEKLTARAKSKTKMKVSLYDEKSMAKRRRIARWKLGKDYMQWMELPSEYRKELARKVTQADIEAFDKRTTARLKMAVK